MKYKIQVLSILHPGKRTDAAGNPHQEDSLFPTYGNATADDRLFVLCDGMGGHDAGEVASATVCDAMSSAILASSDPEGAFTPLMMQKALDNAFNALDEQDTGAARKMGTTMTILKLYDNGALIGHIGDSRVYHIRPGADAASTQILHRTVDHSLVFDMIKANIITEEEASQSPQKNVITRAMQPHLDPRPKAALTKVRDIRPGDYFYLCSDGMLEQMDSAELCEIFSDAGGDIETKRQTLIAETEQNRDNHSAFIIQVLDVIDPGYAETDEFDISCAPENGGAIVTPPPFDAPKMEQNQMTAPTPQYSAPQYNAAPTDPGSDPAKSPGGNHGKGIRILLIILAAILVLAICLFVGKMLLTSKSPEIADPEAKTLIQPEEESPEDSQELNRAKDVLESKTSDEGLTGNINPDEQAEMEQYVEVGTTEQDKAKKISEGAKESQDKAKAAATKAQEEMNKKP